jgi:hypothetical protein
MGGAEVVEPGDEIAGAEGDSRLIASQAGREQVLDALKAAFVQGRLTKAEFDHTGPAGARQLCGAGRPHRRYPRRADTNPDHGACPGITQQEADSARHRRGRGREHGIYRSAGDGGRRRPCRRAGRRALDRLLRGRIARRASHASFMGPREGLQQTAFARAATWPEHKGIAAPGTSRPGRTTPAD